MATQPYRVEISGVGSEPVKLPTVTVVGQREAGRDFKVRLVGPRNTQLVFEASAPVTEQRQASYSNFDITHLPTTIHSFKNTSARKFGITGQLVSRTREEAVANVRNLDLARSWLLPEFGASGAPPPILELYAYGNRNINGKRVILLSYDWTFNADTDYVHMVGQPMPVIGQLTLNLEEVYSAEEITEGAWAISVGAKGSFAGGEQPGDLSSVTDIVSSKGGLMKQLGSGGYITGIGDGLTGSVASLLQKTGLVKPTLAGVVAGQLTRNIGNKVLNSPAISSVISKMPTFASNVFVSGSNASISSLSRVATQRISQLTPPASTATTGPLPTPVIIGDD